MQLNKVNVLCYGCFVIVGILMFMFNTAVIAQEESTDESEIYGYMRVDADAFGTQIWFGATHPCGGLNIESDIIAVGATGELDIGASLSVLEESLTLVPMVGAIFDFESMNVPTFIPQFYIYWALGELYLESWEMAYIGLKDESDPNSFYNRTFLLYSLSDTFSVGPQAELSLNLEDTEDESDALASLLVGGRINVAYGKNNTFSLFLGYEAKEEARGDLDGIAGRFTFVRTW
jgi:hypothetical protein